MSATWIVIDLMFGSDGERTKGQAQGHQYLAQLLGPVFSIPPKGTRVPGWRCPDPECGQVEPSGFSLSINHGWDPDTPGWEPWDGRCRKLKLLAAQRAGLSTV